MLTVIIPALNEEQTISAVIEYCLQQDFVSEVIVVDDKSEDRTAELASKAGAKMIISETRGKGISMKEGIREAKNELIAFLDGDINPYPPNTLRDLTQPLHNDEADFVKGAFARNAGRVTELVAKPLLNILYPGLNVFSQPLSGMIAGKKKFFNKIDFYNDYGVDIGILIDMYLMKARIKEVNIGYIENKSKPWEALGKMSKEVSRAIIAKAQRYKPDLVDEEEMLRLTTINREMSRTLNENLAAFRKMVVFDMDNTILQGRFIDECAKEFKFYGQLEDLRDLEKDPIILSKRIGLLLKGRTIDELLHVISGIPMVEDIREVINDFKEKEYITGIISNSYALITNYVRQQIDADFALANRLEFVEGKASGEVNMPSYFFALPESVCGHGYCKTNALQYACEKYQVKMSNAMVVGDSVDDRCIVAHAGKGFAFCTNDEILRTVAYKAIDNHSFQPMLQLA